MKGCWLKGRPRPFRQRRPAVQIPPGPRAAPEVPAALIQLAATPRSLSPRAAHFESWQRTRPGELRGSREDPSAALSPSVRLPALGRLCGLPCFADFSAGRGGSHQLTPHVPVPVLPLRPRRRGTAVTRGGRSLLPSPSVDGLGLRMLALTRLHLRSLALRPGDSLTTPRAALSMGFRSFGLPPDCHPSYRASGSYPGGTDSHWTC